MLGMSDSLNEQLPAEDDDESEAQGTEEIEEETFAQPVQPVGSQIAIERFADGVTIKVPPAGLFGGTQGLFVFALIWNGFVGVFTVVMLAVFLGTAAKHDQAIWIAPAILSIFWLVGIGILLGSINMGRRQAAIAVTG